MSYEPLKRLMSRFQGQPVQTVMVTSLYGYVGDKTGLTPVLEVEADREYFAVRHGLPFAIAINPPAPRTGAAPDNAARYAVGGIPEIVIIDRKGVIRATVVGWDKGNEQRFAAFIEQLLKEK